VPLPAHVSIPTTGLLKVPSNPKAVNGEESEATKTVHCEGYPTTPVTAVMNWEL
jgi:hypothetical protein